MPDRYDFGGTGWGVGPELSAKRLMMDGSEAELVFLLTARNIHGMKFDYTRMQFRGMKLPITVGINGEWYDVPAYLHLIDGDDGGIFL